MVLQARKKIIFISILFCFFSSFNISAERSEIIGKINTYKSWQVSFNTGIQMSGIKNEDFVISNYSSLLDVTVGKWFESSIAITLGYKGFYFNLISDEKKHYYGYYYGEAVLNVNYLFFNSTDLRKWDVYFHAGSGYFYNYYYGRPNICANFGISNNYKLKNTLRANLKISAILGWDIYQGNEDILPGITLGISYLFE